jgi:hypothetical protein
MRSSILSLALLVAPATLVAQASGSGTGDARTSASASASAKVAVNFEPPREFSAEGRAKLETMYKDARSKELPPEPMARRVAEGQAKGASEVAILAAVEKVRVNLESTHSAMLRAGRAPSHEETAAGAAALERGFTTAQLEAVAKRTPNERSLAVAFDVLTDLSARGVPVNNALAQVQAKLDARASDAALRSLTANVTGTVGIGRGGHQ